jgi:hypothetical protein
MLISAGVISYLGAFTMAYREQVSVVGSLLNSAANFTLSSSCALMSAAVVCQLAMQWFGMQCA